MKYLITFIIAATVSFAGTIGLHLAQNEAEQFAVGADTVRTIGGQSYALSGAGISSSATSITLTSLTIPQTGRKLVDGDFSNTFYLTLEPGSRSRQEFVSCTTVTQNANETATLSGCERGLLPFSPYSASTTYAFSHSGGTSVIFSNPPQLYEQTTFKGNDEAVTGQWSFPTPLGNSAPATKGYVDGLVSGGTVVNEAVVVGGNAGETVATGTLVYFDGTDQEWKKVDTDTSTTYVDKFIGLTQGDGTNGNAIQDGILLKGRDTTQTGLTPGSTYYAQATAGTIGTGATSQPVGVAEDTTVLYFEPQLLLPTESGDNTFTGDNTFSGSNTFTATTTFNESITGHASTTVTAYTSSQAWSKPADFEYIIVEVQGGGGSGGSSPSDDSADGGGGGGGYSKELLTAADLVSTSTVQVTVGSTGGTSSFGNFLSATGGSNGSNNAGGAGGCGSGGDVNICGQGGGGGASGYATSGSGGSSFLGGGGRAVESDSNGAGGGAYGGGGSGASNAAGGTSGQTGGTGAAGVVIVTVYY